MPISKVQRRMRGQWSVVLHRADEYARRLPPEGVSRGRFVADVLGDVDPAYADEIVRIMGRKGIVWLSTYRGEVTVYSSKPGSRPEKELVGKRPVDRFLADLAFLTLDAARFAKCLKSHGTPPEVTEAARVAIARIVAVCERHALKGLPLPEMRAAMWDVFSPGLMQSVSRYEPRLQERSEEEAFTVEAPRRKRLPRGLTTKEKALAIIREGGLKGITKTDLSRRIKPPMSANDLAAVIGELESEKAIVWQEMRKDARSRPGDRLFTSEVGLPKLHSDGTMYHRIEGEYYG